MKTFLDSFINNTATVLLFILAATHTASGAGAFFGEPPNDFYPWAVHDQNRPQPEIVVPGSVYGDPPSDAIILFDGTEDSLENWIHVKPDEDRRTDWVVEDGALVVVRGAGNLRTKAAFGDCQLYIEWAAPAEIKGQGQRRGNSGVFLPGGIEVQVLDNYNNPTYADGSAGSIYGLLPPAANPLRPAGEWQSYEIIYRRPIVRDGVVLDEGSITVLVNGVVVQAAEKFDGAGGYKKRRAVTGQHTDQGTLMLQDHRDRVRYRNIWYRPLRPRPLDGGFDGRLAPEVALAKRAETAENIRKDASDMSGLNKALRLLESLVYLQNESAEEEANQIISEYLDALPLAQPELLTEQKGNVLRLDRALSYLKQYKIIPPTHFAISKVHSLALEQGWKNR